MLNPDNAPDSVLDIQYSYVSCPEGADTQM